MKGSKFYYSLGIAGLISLIVSACAAPSGNQPTNATTVNKSNTYQQLSAMNWRPNTLQTQGKRTTVLASGAPLRAYSVKFFNNGTVHFKGQCNGHNGVATLSNNGRIKFGQFSSTLMGCRNPHGKADREMVNLFQGMQHYQVHGSRLSLSGNNKLLVLNGTPTDEARYGGEGKIRFIEVKNYPHGLIWREVRYSQSGIQLDNMPWKKTPLPTIRGFTPRAHNIVRLKEYQDRSTGKVIWVKDMIVLRGPLN